MSTNSRLPCRHCGRKATIRARGLCYFCYDDPAVRQTYPPSRYAPLKFRGDPDADDFNGGYGLPAGPTAELPGTLAKLDILAERVKARTALHHPDDATFGGERGEV